MQIIILDDKKSPISIKIRHYFYDLTHFKGQGRNTKKFRSNFGSKRKLQNLLLKLTDLQKYQPNPFGLDYTLALYLRQSVKIFDQVFTYLFTYFDFFSNFLESDTFMNQKGNLIYFVQSIVFVLSHTPYFDGFIFKIEIMWYMSSRFEVKYRYLNWLQRYLPPRI